MSVTTNGSHGIAYATEMRELRLIRRAFGEPAPLDTAVSAAILEEVSAGEAPATLRLHRPPAVVAFGPIDRHSPGFSEAIAAARASGFGTVLRLAGGRAAVFHEGTIAFALARPEQDPKSRIRERFEEVSGLIAEALRGLGIDARVGEVPGEYCPGAYSVNAVGSHKLMGVGQRLATAAAHVGGVVVVSGADRVRDVLVPVYGALGIDWDPSTVGSVVGEDPALGWDGVADAILDAFARRYRLVDVALAQRTIDRAGALVSVYEPAI
jgi:octanoyl-[GcvH]:protein N-octanoyltransferase